MSAADLLARVRSRGIELRADGSDLVVRAPNGALDDGDVEALRERKTELLKLLRAPRHTRYETLRAGQGGTPEELLDRFLRDASIPVAIVRSRVLGRDFILARDPASLAALTEADRGLPVLYFADCEKLGRALLELRAELGPEVGLVELRPAAAVQ